MTDQTLQLLHNVRASYPEGSAGRRAAQGQIDAMRLRPVVDPSAFLDPCADSVARAARTADRRPTSRAMARTRPFGKQARRKVRAARAAFNLALLVIMAGTLLTVAVSIAANVNAGVY